MLFVLLRMYLNSHLQHGVVVYVYFEFMDGNLSHYEQNYNVSVSENEMLLQINENIHENEWDINLLRSLEKCYLH